MSPHTIDSTEGLVQIPPAELPAKRRFLKEQLPQVLVPATAEELLQVIPQLPGYRLPVRVQEDLYHFQPIVFASLFELHAAVETRKRRIRFPVEGFAGEYYLNQPREHHQWLAAYVEMCRPMRILELGRRSGNSTYALAFYQDHHAVLDSYDIVDCGNVLDRPNVNIRVYDGDVTRLDYSTYDFVFVDINTDGELEDLVLRSMQRDRYRGLSLWDDIHADHYPGLRRWWRQLETRSELRQLDISATNHFSGTGLLWLE